MNAAADITNQLKRRERRANFHALCQYVWAALQYLVAYAVLFVLVVLWCAV